MNINNWTEFHKSTSSYTRGMKLGDKCSKFQANCSKTLRTSMCESRSLALNHCQHIRGKHISCWNVNDWNLNSLIICLALQGIGGHCLTYAKNINQGQWSTCLLPGKHSPLRENSIKVWKFGISNSCLYRVEVEHMSSR